MKEDEMNRINQIIEENNGAYMSKDQLTGLNIDVNDNVKMAGITAAVTDIDYVDSHNCWVVRFNADGKTQEVPATKVVEAIKSGKMEVVK
jgi:hypothetical protein